MPLAKQLPFGKPLFEKKKEYSHSIRFNRNYIQNTIKLHKQNTFPVLQKLGRPKIR